MSNRTTYRGQGKHLPMGGVCKRYGKSARTIDRWLADERLGFPRPLVIRSRRYFDEQALIAWEREQLERQLAQSAPSKGGQL